MKKVLVLGGGLVGSVIARDLGGEGEFNVTVADLHPGDTLRQLASDHDGIDLVEADCSNSQRIQELSAGRDIVVGAMPGRFGFQALQAVIESGCNFCDISFMPEDAWELDGLARERGVTCVVDMGVAPGMSNLLAGTAAVRLDPCRAIDIYVGGIPADPVEPFKYKAAFSPADVIEEYTRPTRLVEDGAVVVKPALSEPELIGFPGVGTLEAFNTDGLRSLVDRLDVPFMREKTMRYPGHRDMMLQMREAGFFDQDPIELKGVSICPRDVAALLLFPHWTYEEGEADLTVMRVTGTGMLDGRPTRLTWDLHDRADPVSGCSSMSRTTAFPCTIMARMIASGEIEEPGVHVPEDFAAREGVLRSLLEGLEKRGIRYSERIEAMGPSE